MYTSCRWNTNWRFQTLLVKLHLQQVLLTTNSKCTISKICVLHPLDFVKEGLLFYFTSIFNIIFCLVLIYAKERASSQVLQWPLTLLWTALSLKAPALGRRTRKMKWNTNRHSNPTLPLNGSETNVSNVRNPVRPSQFPLSLDREALQTNRPVTLQARHTCILLLFCHSAVRIYTAQ